MYDNILSLVQNCLAGDKSSWDMLFQLCVSVTKNSHNKRYPTLTSDDTDNILSNICTKLFNGGLNNFKGKTNYEFLGYLKTIVKNETVSYLDSLNIKKERNTSLDQNWNNDKGEFSLHDSLKDDHSSPDVICENHTRQSTTRNHSWPRNQPSALSSTLQAGASSKNRRSPFF